MSKTQQPQQEEHGVSILCLHVVRLACCRKAWYIITAEHSIIAYYSLIVPYMAYCEATLKHIQTLFLYSKRKKLNYYLFNMIQVLYKQKTGIQRLFKYRRSHYETFRCDQAQKSLKPYFNVSMLMCMYLLW